MESVTFKQVFEILDKKYELAFARDNHQVMDLIEDVKIQLLELIG